MAVTLAELAERFQCRVRGKPETAITGVAALETAGPRDIAHVSDKRHLRLLPGSAAGAVILTAADAAHYSGTALISDNPRLCFARVAALLHPGAPPAPGVHPSAVVAAGAVIDPSAAVGPLAVIGPGARIGPGVQIGAGCVVGAGVGIGARSRLVARVVVNDDCVIGADCVVHPGAVIGSDGFGYARDGERWVKVPQLGRVVIGDAVEIGANTTIDRGALSDTVIGDGVKLDNQIQIAHNVRIGAHTAMAGCVGVAGSAVIGRRCTVGGQAGILGHLEIADDVHVTAASLVADSITEPGEYSSTLKAEPAEAWRRKVVRLSQLDDLARRLKRLEKEISELSKENKT